MKLKIKTTKSEKLRRFSKDKEYQVIDAWGVLGRSKMPVIKDDVGMRCLIKLKNCSHINGDWEVTEGNIEDLKQIK